MRRAYGDDGAEAREAALGAAHDGRGEGVEIAQGFEPDGEARGEIARTQSSAQGETDDCAQRRVRVKVRAARSPAGALSGRAGARVRAARSTTNAMAWMTSRHSTKRGMRSSMAIAAQAPALGVYVGEEHDRQPREHRPAPGDEPGQAMFGERGLGGFHARQCTPARARSNPRRSIRAFSGAKLLMGLEVGRRVSSGLKALITRFWRERFGCEARMWQLLLLGP